MKGLHWRILLKAPKFLNVEHLGKFRLNGEKKSLLFSTEGFIL